MPSLTIYHFTWCSVVINVIFNTCFSSFICFNGQILFERNFFGCNFELFRENCMNSFFLEQIFSLELLIINVFKITSKFV
jgi:hypothetical protein